MTLTDKIAALREEKGLSKAEMARRMGMVPSFYFKLEKRGNAISVEQLEKIAEALGVSVVGILNYDPEPPITFAAKLLRDNEREREVEANVEGLKEENRLMNQIISDAARRAVYSTRFYILQRKPEIGKYWRERSVGLEDTILMRGLFKRYAALHELVEYYLRDNRLLQDRWQRLRAVYAKIPSDFITFEEAKGMRNEDVQAIWALNIRQLGKQYGFPESEIEEYLKTEEIPAVPHDYAQNSDQKA